MEFWEQLPEELRWEVFSKLSISDLKHLSLCSKSLHALVNSNEYWRQRLSEDFHLDGPALNQLIHYSHSKNYRELYKQACLRAVAQPVVTMMEQLKQCKITLSANYFKARPWFVSAQKANAFSYLLQTAKRESNQASQLVYALSEAQLKQLPKNLAWIDALAEAKNELRALIEHQPELLQSLSLTVDELSYGLDILTLEQLQALSGFMQTPGRTKLPLSWQKIADMSQPDVWLFQHGWHPDELNSIEDQKKLDLKVLAQKGLTIDMAHRLTEKFGELPLVALRILLLYKRTKKTSDQILQDLTALDKHQLKATEHGFAPEEVAGLNEWAVKTLSELRLKGLCRKDLTGYRNAFCPLYHYCLCHWLQQQALTKEAALVKLKSVDTDKTFDALRTHFDASYQAVLAELIQNQAYSLVKALRKVAALKPYHITALRLDRALKIEDIKNLDSEQQLISFLRFRNKGLTAKMLTNCRFFADPQAGLLERYFANRGSSDNVYPGLGDFVKKIGSLTEEGIEQRYRNKRLI